MADSSASVFFWGRRTSLSTATTADNNRLLLFLPFTIRVRDTSIQCTYNYLSREQLKFTYRICLIMNKQLFVYSVNRCHRWDDVTINQVQYFTCRTKDFLSSLGCTATDHKSLNLDLHLLSHYELSCSAAVDFKLIKPLVCVMVLFYCSNITYMMEEFSCLIFWGCEACNRSCC